MRPTTPLLLLTIGQGLAGGMVLTFAVLHSLGALGGPASRDLLLMALAAAAAGGVGSLFHMHRIQAARFVLRRLKSSWLSREALTTGLFAAGLAVLTGWTLLGGQGSGAYLALTWLVALVGLVAMWVTAMLYATIPAMLSWHTPKTVLSFLAVGIFSGWAAAGLAAPYGAGALRPMSGVLLGLVVLTALVKLVHWQHFRSARLTLRGSRLPFEPYRLQDTGTTKPPYRTQTQVWPTIRSQVRRTMLFVTAGLLLVVPLLLSLLLLTGPSLGARIGLFLSVLLGTIAERWLFFADATHSSRVFFDDTVETRAASSGVMAARSAAGGDVKS